MASIPDDVILGFEYLVNRKVRFKTTQGTWNMAQCSAQALEEWILIARLCPNSHYIHLSNLPQLSIEQNYSIA